MQPGGTGGAVYRIGEPLAGWITPRSPSTRHVHPSASPHVPAPTISNVTGSSPKTIVASAGETSPKRSQSTLPASACSATGSQSTPHSSKASIVR
jgi:hypothetical protein